MCKPWGPSHHITCLLLARNTSNYYVLPMNLTMKKIFLKISIGLNKILYII